MTRKKKPEIIAPDESRILIFSVTIEGFFIEILPSYIKVRKVL